MNRLREITTSVAQQGLETQDVIFARHSRFSVAEQKRAYHEDVRVAIPSDAQGGCRWSADHLPVRPSDVVVVSRQMARIWAAQKAALSSTAELPTDDENEGDGDDLDAMAAELEKRMEERGGIVVAKPRPGTEDEVEPRTGANEFACGLRLSSPWRSPRAPRVPPDAGRCAEQPRAGAGGCREPRAVCPTECVCCSPGGFDAATLAGADERRRTV